MADDLNIYFSSVFTLKDKNNLPVQQPLLADNVVSYTYVDNAGYDSNQYKKSLKIISHQGFMV